MLHAVQNRIGWVSPGALNYVALRLDVAPAEVYGVASFYGMFSLQPRPPVVAHVCDDIACLTRGADKLAPNWSSGLAPQVPLAPRDAPPGCAANVWACVIARRRRWSVRPARHRENECWRRHRPTPSSLCWAMRLRDECPPSRLRPRPALRKRLCQQADRGRLRLLHRIGRGGSGELDGYCRLAGYEACAKLWTLALKARCVKFSPPGCWAVVGRRFPRPRNGKRCFLQRPRLRDDPNRAHYVVCNADESEPGTFKDRVLMEGDPFAVLEGMTIAGFVTGARKGYIYLRGEYPLAAERMQSPSSRPMKTDFSAQNILGSGLQFDIEIRRGAGAYICGEETALFNSIEGYRGEPRNKPPFPTQSGLFHQPTAINNVETLVNVPVIVNAKAGQLTPGWALKTPQGHGLLPLRTGGAARCLRSRHGTTLRQLIDHGRTASTGAEAAGGSARRRSRNICFAQGD